MKKSNYLVLLFGVFAGLLSSCSDDNIYNTYITEQVSPSAGLSITTMGDGTFTMELTDSLVFRAALNANSPATAFKWAVNETEVSTDSIYVFKTDRSGKYNLALTVSNADTAFTQKADIVVREGKYKHGTFILNEGLIATHGSLIYISPEGEITPNAYRAVNKKTLFSLTEDMFIHDNKIYIVSQKSDIPGNYGGLTILNAETLKEELRYSFPEGQINQPTHISVLSKDDIYMRNAKGISVFRLSDSTMTFVEGSEGAHWNTMAVAHNKVFSTYQNEPSVMVIEKGATKVSHKITFKGLVSGIIPSSDGKLWVSDETGTISKVDPDTYEIIDAHTLKGKAAQLLKRNPASSQAAAPHITAKGDTIYMSATKTEIWCHIFGMNQTAQAMDVKRYHYIPDSEDYYDSPNFQAYNTCAVDPVTGEVYLNTLMGFGGYRHRNHISVFNFKWDYDPDWGSLDVMIRLSRDYSGYLDYPSNVYFTHNFFNIAKFNN